jgi:hypothetical protein
MPKDSQNIYNELKSTMVCHASFDVGNFDSLVAILMPLMPCCEEAI